MSSPFGAIDESDRKPGNAGDDNRNGIAENGTGRTEGNDSGNDSVFGSYETINPANFTERITRTEPANGNAGGEPRRTRSGRIDRRTRAGRNAAQETPDSVRPHQPQKLVSLDKAIIGLHDMAAAIFGIEELMLTDAEGKEYSDAVMEVSKYYVPSIDPKTVAFANLIVCMGGIYTTRIMAYRVRAEKERRANLRVMPGAQPQPQPQQPAATPKNAPADAMALNPPVYGGGEF